MRRKVNREQVLAFRARASHLDHRLPAREFARAAAGGLQDSAPRAALISLHARVRDVLPGSWEDPGLAQIWGPRGADYIVPREDLGVFTVGRMPRDPDLAARIERLGNDVVRACDGRKRSSAEIEQALPDLRHGIRDTAITGRVLIRWDASRIWVIPNERPRVDPEEARLELARRFLSWFAPTTEDRFVWWSGVERDDARATWAALGGEMREVTIDGAARFVLNRDEEALARAAAIRGVRLIPHGDPFIKTDAELLVPDAQRRLEIFPVPRSKPAFWPVSGAVLAAGEIVGSWARQQRRVTVHPWGPLSEPLRAAIEREALALPIAAAKAAAVHWAC